MPKLDLGSIIGPSGHDGISPKAAFSKIVGGHKMVVTDAEGDHEIDIMDGEKGSDGPPGPVGQGIAAGGKTGQILVKSSDGDYQTAWEDQTAFGDTISKNNGVVDVAIPVKQVSQSEYNEMSEDEKEQEAVYLVDEPPFLPVSVSIQEYDTEIDGCQWHVRKWSDGYIDMFGKKHYKMPVSTAFGSLYRSNGVVGNEVLPVHLIQKYGEHDVLSTDISVSASLSVAPRTTTIVDLKDWNELTRTNASIIMTVSNQSNVEGPVFFHVFGRWK